MFRAKLWSIVAVVLVSMSASALAQTAVPRSSDVAPFIGTWDVTMTNPQGSKQTVKLWEQDGGVRASLQIDKSPPVDVTGIFKDGEMLVLTTTLRENGAPIWAVIALTLDGETMSLAKMLQRSETIKRGTGHKRGSPAR